MIQLSTDIHFNFHFEHMQGSNWNSACKFFWTACVDKTSALYLQTAS